MLESDH